jgi:hypothetical protein
VITDQDDAEGVGVRWTSRPLSTTSGAEAEKRLGLPDWVDCGTMDMGQVNDVQYDEWTGISIITRFDGSIAVVKI